MRSVFGTTATEMEGYHLPLTVAYYVGADGSIKWELMGSINLNGAFVCDGTLAYKPEWLGSEGPAPWRIDPKDLTPIARGKFLKCSDEPPCRTGKMEVLPLRIIVVRASVEVEDNNSWVVSHDPEDVYVYDMKPYHAQLDFIATGRS